jgi:hypothetical protein
MPVTRVVRRTRDNKTYRHTMNNSNLFSKPHTPNLRYEVQPNTEKSESLVFVIYPSLKQKWIKWDLVM